MTVVHILYYQKYTGKKHNITVSKEQINNCERNTYFKTGPFGPLCLKRNIARRGLLTVKFRRFFFPPLSFGIDAFNTMFLFGVSNANRSLWCTLVSQRSFLIQLLSFWFFFFSVVFLQVLKNRIPLKKVFYSIYTASHIQNCFTVPCDRIHYTILRAHNTESKMPENSIYLA